MLLVPLEEETVFEIAGPDAERYLQGQTTCDVAALSLGQATMGALCDLKGRVEATFYLYREEEERFWLVVPSRMAEPVLARLQRYRLRSRVDFARSGPRSFGLFGTPPEGVPAWKTPFGASRLLAVPEALFPALAEQIHLKPESFWRLREIEAGVPTILPETASAFLPQMLDLDRLGAVSFAKGCYLGQEVVARAQFRGEVKRRLFYGEIVGRNPPPPGSPLLAGGERIGTVVGAAFDEEENRTRLLAVVLVERAAEAVRTERGEAVGVLRRPERP